jgi:hypothetical protein
VNLIPIPARQSFIRPEIVGWCVGRHKDGSLCNAPVRTGEGYADTDGSPFKAYYYYCPVCANVARVLATRPYFNVKDPS